MPLHPFSGKSKEDLVIVARLSGLLSKEDAIKMSKPALRAFLISEQMKADQAGQPAEKPKPKLGRPRKNAVGSVTISELPAATPMTSTPVEELAAVAVLPIETLTAAPKKRGRKPGTTVKAAKSALGVDKTRKRRVPDATEPVVLEQAAAEREDSGQSEPEAVPVISLLVKKRGRVSTRTVEKEFAAENSLKAVVKKRERIIEAQPQETISAAKPLDSIIQVQVQEPAAATKPQERIILARPRETSDTVRSRDAFLSRQPTNQQQTGHHERHHLSSTHGVEHSQLIPAHHTRTSLPNQPPETDRDQVAQPAAFARYRPQEEAMIAAAADIPADIPDAAGNGEPKTNPLVMGRADAEYNKTRRPTVETGDMVAGVLEVMPDGYGFLRKENYLQGSHDIYVPPQYIRRFNLRPGDWVVGPGKVQRETDRYQALLYIKEVNGMPPEKMIRRPQFDKLTPIYPEERFELETIRNELSTRIIDLVSPIGKGQRGMIVSPPKAGKTILLQKIANAISINNPDVKLIVLLIDERPEEVTDMQRSINGEVVYSTFDKTPENHVKVTELVLERAMRLVELQQDVVILLDSITRLGRAYNLTINPTGRTLSGGLDPGALYGPKRFFGAARNIEGGGSLTIIATALIDTGSRMDEVIFEEFKGTGNMEVYLDRKLSEKRIFPAIDLNRSGTRREELLLTPKELDAVWAIRKAFGQLDTASVTEMIINLLIKTNNNQHFVSSVNVSLNDKNIFEAMRGNRTGSQVGAQGNSTANGTMAVDKTRGTV